MKYNLMLFDLDNTLICFETAQKNALIKTLGLHNLPYSEELLGKFQSINDQLWHSFEKRKITKNEVFIHRFKMLLKGTSDAKCGQINGDFLGLLSENPVTLPGVQEFLTRIHGKCQIGIVTNGDSLVQKKKLAQLPYKSSFDFMVISEEAGHPKPAPEIYQHALDLAGLSTDQANVLMTGDNLNADIMGALNVGFDACWYNPEGKKRPRGIKPTLEIGNYVELLQFLNQSDPEQVS